MMAGKSGTDRPQTVGLGEGVVIRASIGHISVGKADEFGHSGLLGHEAGLFKNGCLRFACAQLSHSGSCPFVPSCPSAHHTPRKGRPKAS
jgi:hypothetical protein